MRRLAANAALATTLAICLAPAAASAAVTAVTAALVPARSHASFVVTHLFVERVTGNVPILAGTATFATSDATVPQSVRATLDPRRIDTHDADRDADLQGPDWFDVARFPTWTFVSDAIAATPAGFDMAGTLTVHGVAQPVTLHVVRTAPLPHARFRATATVHRHDFGMRVTPMDGVIGNDLELTLDVAFEPA